LIVSIIYFIILYLLLRNYFLLFNYFTTDYGSKLKNLIGGVGKKLAMTEWVVPPGMERIPFESVAKTGSRKVVNGKEVHEEARENVAKLCQALNVDAVAIIQIDMAYKTGMLSGMSGTGVFSGVLGRAIGPSEADGIEADFQRLLGNGLFYVHNIAHI